MVIIAPWVSTALSLTRTLSTKVSFPLLRFSSQVCARAPEIRALTGAGGALSGAGLFAALGFSRRRCSPCRACP